MFTFPIQCPTCIHKSNNEIKLLVFQHRLISTDVKPELFTESKSKQEKIECVRIRITQSAHLAALFFRALMTAGKVFFASEILFSKILVMQFLRTSSLLALLGTR